ncbi:hypothetical protein GOP47_0027427, partial [Adiantum capillus-veneris]
MAWDSTSFPWEWDAETFHLPGHGVETDLRKSSGISRALETDLCVGKNGVSPHISKELGSSVPNTTAISLGKHDTLQVQWHMSNNGLVNGAKKDQALPKGTTTSTKHDAPHVEWHTNRHNNNISKEVGLVVYTDETTPSAKHVALDDRHASQHTNGDNRGGGMVIYPMSSTKLTESNINWQHVNKFVGSALESTNNVMLSTGLASHGNVSCVTTGVLPIVTTCTGIKNGPFTGCISDVTQGPTGKTVQKGVNVAWKKMDYGFAGVFESGTPQASSMHHAQHQQVLGTRGKTQISAVEVKEEKGVVSTSKGVGMNDEQHSSNATGSAGSARTAFAIPRCQVEGCKLDLTSAKDYHRRHKVCEPHSKAGKVVVAGTEQRFCQQCSRFHLISEFDEAKRSCRRRLAGHNERRRKPQPDPLALHTRLHSTFE